MWKQISLTEALQGFLAGRTVKIVDVEVGSIENLQEALQSFFEGAVFLVDKGTDAIPPETARILGLPKGSTLQDVNQMISNAIRSVNDAPAAASEAEEPATAEDLVPTAAAPEPPRVSRAKKQLDEAEKAYQSRKISDLGKLRSLRAARWDVEKIATELGCSGQTVRNTMKREGIE